MRGALTRIWPALRLRGDGSARRAVPVAPVATRHACSLLPTIDTAAQRRRYRRADTRRPALYLGVHRCTDQYSHTAPAHVTRADKSRRPVPYMFTSDID